MCRGFQQSETERVLKIKAFYLRFSLSSSSSKSITSFPDSLTLHYLPRINGTQLEINHSKIRPDTPAFLTLHRVVSTDSDKSVSYGSRERVKASQGARFEVFFGDVKVVKGFFRKDWDDTAWKMECSCGIDGGSGGGRILQEVIREAEVSVAAEGEVVMTEKVKIVAKRRRSRSPVECCQLEEIPEETEYCDSNDGSCCCCCYEEDDESTEEEYSEEEEEEEEMAAAAAEEESVSWAVDVGIWVMCLGVGLLVSKASSKRLLRRTRLV